MADVKIRNLDDDLHRAYRALAEAEGTSLEEQLRRALRAYLADDRRAMIEEVRQGLREMREKYGEMPDSTPGIRANRDRRG